MCPASSRSRLRRSPKLILLFVATTLLTVYAIFQLGRVWLNAEIDRQVELTLRRHADGAAAELSKGWRTDLPDPYRDPDNMDRVEMILHALVNSHSNVLGAIFVDTRGLVRHGYFEDKPGGVPLAAELRRVGGLVNIAEDDLIRHLMNTYPRLTASTNELGQKSGPPIGQMILIIDGESHYNMPEDTSLRLAAWLGLMLLGVFLLIGSALWIIYRQQTLADRLRVQRDKAERSAYVGTLAAGLAHEIRNPINALNMQLEMLEEDIAEGNRPSASKRIQRLHDGLQGVEHTVRDFLTYATPQTQKPSWVELAQELEALCSALAPAEGAPPVEITRLIARDLRAWCDPHAVRQIVSILLSNAVRIQRGRDRAAIRIEAVRQGGTVELIFDDAGPGIPPGQSETIFEAFFTTHPDGTGLGLAIARRLAEMNGGRLIARSAPSPLGGARFSLLLPVQPPADPAA